MRRLLFGLGLVGGAILALSGCASQGYGSAGGFESYDDCYDGYCVGYDSYGRAYRRPQSDERKVDRIERSHGETRIVDRGATRASASSPTSAAMRTSVSRSAPPPPPPATVSRRP